LNFFIVYVALPAPFYRILAQTPLEQLRQVAFIVATTPGTALAFALSFGIGSDGGAAAGAQRVRAGAQYDTWVAQASSSLFGLLRTVGSRRARLGDKLQAVIVPCHSRSLVSSFSISPRCCRARSRP